MIKLQGKLPRELYVACSGGVDSMAAVSFLQKNHKLHLIFVDHKTQTSKEAKEFLKSKFREDLLVFEIDENVPNGISQEEHWRNQRYRVFHQIGSQNKTVVTCHHLDDCVETWIWSSMHGNGKIIPYRNRNVVRPFRLTQKQEFVKWCTRRNIEWVEDNSNKDTKYTRNYIRHEFMPHVLTVNPGIQKVIAKKVKRDFDLYLSAYNGDSPTQET